MLAPDSSWKLKMLAPDSAWGLVQPWSLVQAHREKLVQVLVQALVQAFFAVSLLICLLSKNACTKLLESKPLDTLQRKGGNT